VKVPGFPLAVKVGAVAIPFAPLTTVVAPAKAPLAPGSPGVTEKVTAAPGTGFPN